jgi:hypothetical protein
MTGNAWALACLSWQQACGERPRRNKVGLQRLNFEQRESISRDRAKQKHAGLAKSVETYLARMGMPKRLFQEITQQSSEKVLLLDARRLKALGLDGTDPAYEQWLRANENQERSRSN